MAEIFDILGIIDETVKQILFLFIELVSTSSPFEAEKIIY